jgi:heptosyltransferase II
VPEAPRVLIIQTAFLGDVVLTTPLFRALKRVAPACRLTALVTPQAAPLLEEDPHLDEVLTYEKQAKRRESLQAVVQRIRSRSFDWLLAPHRSHRTSLVALLSGIPVRIGFSDAGFAWSYNRRVARPWGAHEVDRNLELLKALGTDPEPSDRRLHVGYGEPEAEAVREVLARAGVAGGERLVGLSPGSVWATKRWPAEGFGEVARSLAGQGLRPVLLGSPGDADVAAQVAQVAGLGLAVDAVGRTSLKALAAWMDRLSLLVTNDSAPLHVAAARGTPTVALFGATTPALGFAPLHERSKVLEVALSCRPCGLHGARRCPKRHFRCMRELEPARVLEACRELLAAGESR